MLRQPPRAGEIAELVDNQQRRSGEEPHHRGLFALDRGAVAAGGEVGGRGEVDPVSGADRGVTEAGRNVGLWRLIAEVGIHALKLSRCRYRRLGMFQDTNR